LADYFIYCVCRSEKIFVNKETIITVYFYPGIIRKIIQTKSRDAMATIANMLRQSVRRNILLGIHIRIRAFYQS
jgi:hypothetical protein